MICEHPVGLRLQATMERRGAGHTMSLSCCKKRKRVNVVLSFFQNGAPVQREPENLPRVHSTCSIATPSWSHTLTKPSTASVRHCSSRLGIRRFVDDVSQSDLHVLAYALRDDYQLINLPRHVARWAGVILTRQISQSCPSVRYC